MRKLMTMLIVVLALTLALAACGGDNGGNSNNTTTNGEEVAATTGDAANGEKLYKQTVIGSASAPGCATCHSLEEGVTIVGPSHAGLAGRAGSYVAGESAEAYLRESITEPDAHVVDGFTPGVMYQLYGQDLSEQEIADLVAYLLTLN